MVAVALVASAAVIAACGGDDDATTSSGSTSGSGTSSTAGASATPNKGPALKGEPIKTMTIASVNWNGPQYPNILETAKLYAKWVNDNGGIAGRPLEVEVCDEMGDPNQLATCGRNAIAHKDVAVVGSYSIAGDRIVPVLENGQTAWFGTCCALTPAEANSPVSFNFGPGAANTAAYAVKAADMGCKKASLVSLDIPTKNQGFEAWSNVLESRGVAVGPKVAVPLAAADYAPQVAQATGSGVDCVIGGLTETQWAAFLPAFKQSGSTARLIGAQGNLNQKVIKNFPEVGKGAQIIGTFPDITAPAFKDFKDAIATYKPTEGLDYNSLAGLGTWTAYTAFKSIVEGMKGPVDNKTFLAAAGKATAVDTGGMLPVMNLSKPWVKHPSAPSGSSTRR
jgi:ABC-type branched-subunit amino acid transport system substrate-binding protein